MSIFKISSCTFSFSFISKSNNNNNTGQTIADSSRCKHSWQFIWGQRNKSLELFGIVWNFCNTATGRGAHCYRCRGALLYYVFSAYSIPLTVSLCPTICLPSANQLARAHKLIQFNVNFEICLCDFYVAEHSGVGSTAVMGFYMGICGSLSV